jgi:hypothetical protein
MTAHTLDIDLSADRSDNIVRMLDHPEALADLIEVLTADRRRLRQYAVAILAGVAKESPELLVDYAEAFCDALYRPEAQTRWECLDILRMLVPLDPAACAAGVPGAEDSLYDEESGPVRLAAMRFLCAFGATSVANSKQVWPYIDEGIQCYHGDFEFPDMMVSIVTFSQGSIDPSVKKSLSDRMRFDAENARGPLKRRAQQIVENCN